MKSDNIISWIIDIVIIAMIIGLLFLEYLFLKVGIEETINMAAVEKETMLNNGSCSYRIILGVPVSLECLYIKQVDTGTNT